jgi:hypothetical protein
MPQTRTTAAVAVRTEPAKAWVFGAAQITGEILSRTGGWAADTAQQFGAVLAALMGPAVFSVYAFAFWSLASNLGWTNTFVFPSGPLSNWLIWLGLAILVSLAASVLKRHAQGER